MDEAPRDDIWRVAHPRDLVWESFEDGSVVFSARSGATDYLDPIAGEALRTLSSRALSVTQLCVVLADNLDAPNDDTLRTYVTKLIEQLRELGLAESSRP